MKGDRERCLAAGMDDYITKPFDSRTLCHLIEAAAGAVAPEPSAQPAPADLPEAVLDRVGGDRALLGEMIRLFAEDAPQTADRIRAAIDARDSDALRRAAHALKGAAANFDAAGVVQAARARRDGPGRHI
jgi:CheY-like chemotaxis protein